jgi:Spy/CpxP family protein refolding chaperone
MKRAAILAIFPLILAFGACDSDDPTRPVQPETASLVTDAYAVVDEEDAFANIQDATLDEPMAMNAVYADPAQFRRHPKHPGHPGSHLGPILVQLGLDDAQKAAIKEAILDHRRRIRPVLEDLREANAELLAAANAERQEIVESYRAGEITREEAVRRLVELAIRTRQAIRENPANAPYLRMLCDSKRALFQEVRSILNEEQREIWDRWVEALPGPCVR